MDICISFLILTYNTDEWLLKRCLDSILSQDLKISYEIIIVDDGSTISPCDFIESYNCKLIRYFERKSGGRGPGAARNVAINMAKGEYLTFVDSDDYLFPNTFDKVLSELSSNKYPDILRFNFRKTKNNDVEKIENKNIEISQYNQGVEYVINNNLLGANCGYLIKKKVIIDNSITFIENIFHEDEDFITRLFFYAGAIIDTNIVAYAYYIRPNSIVNNQTSNSTQKRIDDFLISLESVTRLKSSYLYTTSGLHKEALNKKITFLTIDFLIKITKANLSKVNFDQYINKLQSLNLLPLPKSSNYGIKYLLFKTILILPFSYSLLATTISINGFIKSKEKL